MPGTPPEMIECPADVGGQTKTLDRRRAGSTDRHAQLFSGRHPPAKPELIRDVQLGKLVAPEARRPFVPELGIGMRQPSQGASGVANLRQLGYVQ
jgi:hypothetical protein